MEGKVASKEATAKRRQESAATDREARRLQAMQTRLRNEERKAACDEAAQQAAERVGRELLHKQQKAQQQRESARPQGLVTDLGKVAQRAAAQAARMAESQREAKAKLELREERAATAREEARRHAEGARQLVAERQSQQAARRATAAATASTALEAERARAESESALALPRSEEARWRVAEERELKRLKAEERGEGQRDNAERVRRAQQERVEQTRQAIVEKGERYEQRRLAHEHMQGLARHKHELDQQDRLWIKQGLAQLDDAPGPRACSRPDLSSAPAYSMAAHTSDVASAGASPASPGPAAYLPEALGDSHLRNAPEYSMAGKHGAVPADSRRDGPGPRACGRPDLGRAPSYSMQGRVAWELEEPPSDAPGPIYLLTGRGNSRHRDAPAHTIAGKPAAAEPEATPGPGSYGGAERTDLRMAPSYTMQGRDTWARADRDEAYLDLDAEAGDEAVVYIGASPGPIYHPGLRGNSRCQQAPAYTMAGKYDSKASAEATPGPSPVGTSHLPRAPSHSLVGRGAWESAWDGASASPGPGAYLPSGLDGTGLPDAPAFTMAARHVTPPDEAGPGPDRLPARVDLSSAPSYLLRGRDAWREREGAAATDDTPGPTYYAETSGTSKLPRAPAYSMAGRFDATGAASSAGTPGPETAAAGDAHAMPTAPAYTIQGRGAWEPPDLPAHKTPPPGSYSPSMPSHLLDGPTYSMAARFSSGGEVLPDGPGPGAAVGDAHLPHQPAYSIQGLRRPSRAPQTPGPAAYAPPMPARLPCAPSYSFPGKSAEPTLQPPTPAAEAFERPDFRAAPAVTLKGKVFELPAEPTPGPADYSARPPSGGAPAITLKGKAFEPAPSVLPGPGAYSSDDGASAKAAPKFSMRGRLREPTRGAADAPKDYDHQQPYLRVRHASAPAVSIKGKALGGWEAAQLAPGPGEYATSTLTHKGQSLLGRSCACGGPCRHDVSHPVAQGPRDPAHVTAECPWVRDIYPKLRKLPPAATYQENVARAASLLSAAQLEQLQSKYANLSGLQVASS